MVRFIVCMMLGGFIASSYFIIAPEYPSANVLASSQILLSKGIKGIYPPLSGDQFSLYGKWKIGLISSVDQNMDFYQLYQI